MERINPNAIAELMAVLPPFLRGVRPSGRAWTVSRASYVHELGKYIVFHLDCKKLILRVWEIAEDVFLGIEPKHGSAKDYVIHYFEPSRIYQKEETTIFSNEEWKKTTSYGK